MVITNELQQDLLIDNIYAPIPTELFWVLDLEQEDFMMCPLSMLEEVIGPTIWIRANEDAIFQMPTTWNLLIYSEDTGQVDIVDGMNLTTGSYTALLGGVNVARPAPCSIQVVDYKPEATNVCPALSKHQMLCHPIGDGKWVMVTPCDVYNKYLKDASAGDYY